MLVMRPKLDPSCTFLVIFSLVHDLSKICTFFDKVSIDAQIALTFEKRPLVTELKLKMTKSHQALFLISALPLEGTFQISAHFLHLLTLCKKNTFRFFICCLLRILASYLGSILKMLVWSNSICLCTSKVCLKSMTESIHLYMTMTIMMWLEFATQLNIPSCHKISKSCLIMRWLAVKHEVI